MNAAQSIALLEAHMFACGKYLVILAGAVSLSAYAVVPPLAVQDSTAQMTGGPMAVVPLKSWPVDAKSFVDAHRAPAKSGNLKSATDLATVYRPIAVCRLVDTRPGVVPAPAINIGGPLLGGSITNVNAAGHCGIPSGTGVSGLSVSITVFNTTVNNGGYIALLQQGAPVTGVNAVFNTGAQWIATTANVSIGDDSGNFEIFIAQSTVHVIIDVNGYYQDLDNVDVGTQELDVVGDGDGDTFEVSNLGTGSALAGSAFGGGAGVKINSGSFAVSGAAIDSGTTAFVFEVNTGTNVCGGNPSVAVINHPMLNGDGSALVLVTPREGTQTSVLGTAPAGSAGPMAAVWHACGTTDPNGRWGIRDKSGAALVNHSQYSIFIIKSQ